MKPFFADRQLKALAQVCDAFIPSVERDKDPHGFWRRSASDAGVPEAIAELVEGLPEAERREMRQLLSLLASPILGFTWSGPMKAFGDLSAHEREALLCEWSEHRLPQLRKAYLSLKGLVGMLYYGMADRQTPNPVWPAIGYPGPPAPPDADYERPIVPLRLISDTVLYCDTVVVGSGAGGGVVAGELAAAGEDVIVVEKGPYVDRDEIDGVEARAMERMYDRKGALATRDGSVSVLAGSCLGGGTTINWGGAFRLPDYVLDQWARDHGLSELDSADFRRSFDAMEAVLNVGTDRGDHNPQNRALISGCESLGMHVRDIPRNMREPANELEWKGIGFSTFGDRFGVKQGMVDTSLRVAARAGARFLVNADARRVVIEHGIARGVVVSVATPDAAPVSVEIRARRVVIAAGTIHTPALLMRSGIEHSHIGRHLYLHPTVAVAGRYSRRMDSWHGPMMSAVSDSLARMSGTYGVKLETPPIHPGILALALPWRSGRSHKEAMEQASHVGALIVLTRDRFGGRVKTGSDGQPVLAYRLSTFDRDHMLAGVTAAARIHLAAGAEVVHLPHNTAPVVHRGSKLDNLEEEIGSHGWAVCRFPLFSAHQMGTCRMGGDDGRHPAAPDGQLRGVRGLYVADASLFPESSGANPMLTVQALAHYLAQKMKAQGSGTRRPTAEVLQA